MSCVGCSAFVAGSSCGASSYSLNPTRATAFVAARPYGSIGAVVSPVPRTTGVNIVTAAMSGRKPVFPKASMQSGVAFGLAIIAIIHDQCRIPSETGCERKPVP